MRALTRRRLAGASALLLLFSLVPVFALPAAGIHGSTFEIDGDRGGVDDWEGSNADAFNVVESSDVCSNGEGDDKLVSSTKLNAPWPTDTGNVVGKGDLCRVWTGFHQAADGDIIFLFAWERRETNGEVTVYVPLDGPPLDDPGNNLVLDNRTGDLLVKFEYDSDTKDIRLNTKTWTTAGCDKNASACWSADAPLGAFVDAKVSPSTDFGEAAVNLTESGILPSNECRSFVGTTMISETGQGAANATLKDVVLLDEPIEFNSCGTVTVLKATSPAGLTPTAPFTFTLDGVDTDYVWNGQLAAHGSSASKNDVKPGTYTLIEDVPVDTNFALEAITCDGDDVLGGQFAVAANSDVECTITNALQLVPPEITVDKTANPTSLNEPGGQVTFSVTVTNNAPAGIGDATLDSLVDDIHGNLAGRGTCIVPQPLAGGGGSYSCSFTAAVLGNAGYSEKDTITASASNPAGSDTASDDATVTILDVKPTISVDKSANPSFVDEPGGSVTYTVTVTNNSVESVTITELTDDKFGTLAGDADCKVDTVLAANGGSCSFTFVETITGNEGDEHTNVVTAKAEDDENNVATATDDAKVTVRGLDPVITVEKSASPQQLAEPGGSVTYTVTVTNNSVESVTITELTDDKFGTLAGDADCKVDTVLAANGGSCSFTFVETLSGDAGDTHKNTVTAKAVDDEENEVSATDDATVTFTDVKPLIAVDKTANPASVSEPGGSVTYTVTVTNNSVESVTITELTDDKFGTLAGDADCKVDTVLAANGGNCTFTFAETITGNAGFVHTNTVVAKAVDNEENEASSTDDATVTVLGVDSSIEVVKTANPTSLLAPGGNVTYTVVVKNLSAVDTVYITSLVDDKFGDLDGQGTCSLGSGEVSSIVLEPGETYSCEFTKAVSGSAGGSHTNIVTAEGYDDDEEPVSDSDDATVTFTSTPTTQPPALGTVGDLVWNDINANGIQDPLEPGIAGVKIELINSSGVVVGTTFTDANGNYLFTNVPAGTYTIRFELPNFDPVLDEQFVAVGVGTNPLVDSNAGVGGVTAPFTVAGGTVDLTIDAGVFVVAIAGTTIAATTVPTVSASTLPFTGPSGTGSALALGMAIAGLGGLILAAVSREEEEERRLRQYQ